MIDSSLPPNGDSAARHRRSLAVSPEMVFAAGASVAVFGLVFWWWVPILDWLNRPADSSPFVRLQFFVSSDLEFDLIRFVLAVDVTVLVVVVLLAFQFVVTAGPGRGVWGVAWVTAGLFVAGCVFGWFVVVPRVLDVVVFDGYAFTIHASEYLGLLWLTVMTTGCVSQSPAVYALGRVEPRTARRLVCSWGVAVVSVVVTSLLWTDAYRGLLLVAAAGLLLLCGAIWKCLPRLTQNSTLR